MNKPEMTYEQWLVGKALQGLTSGPMMSQTNYNQGPVTTKVEIAKMAVELAKCVIQFQAQDKKKLPNLK